MSNIIKIKHGNSPPTTDNLENYELGYANKGLYIKDNNQIIHLNSGTNLSGIVPISHGGTGADNAANARTNLGLGSLATANSISLSSNNITGTLPISKGGTGKTTQLTYADVLEVVRSSGVTGEDGGHQMAMSWARDHVIVGIDNNAAVKHMLDTSMVIDYIVEQGVSEGWTYIKWNSGRAECYRKTTSANLGTTGQINGFYYRFYSINLPTGLFIEVTDAQVSADWGTGVSWGSVKELTTTTLEAQYFSNQNGGAGTFFHNVKGRWK